MSFIRNKFSGFSGFGRFSKFSRSYCKDYKDYKDYKHNKNNTFQYVSDLHVDVAKNKNLKIIPNSNVLIVAGDIGNPFHDGFKTFLQSMSKQFEKVIFVAGNHDFDSGSIFDKNKYDMCKPQIYEICNELDNVIFLDNDVHIHKGIVFAGTTLWTQIPLKNNTISEETICQHNDKHKESVKFIKSTCNKFKLNPVVIISHYVPTFQLIEDKYKRKNNIELWRWTTDLENDIMKKYPQISTWICGHSHSVKSKKIKYSTHSVNCLLNAHGYPKENDSDIILTKTFKV